jgi:hypothetical protein
VGFARIKWKQTGKNKEKYASGLKELLSKIKD